ncbi:MAG: helix-turn-helix domain-containing protein [Acidimicrobiales bacterium]
MSIDLDTVGYPRKRRQTRRRLLNAGMAVLAERGPGHMTAAQVAKEAGVAIGTFYNHFPTIDDIIEAIANDLGRGVEISSDTLNEIEHDPARRVAIGVIQLLHMAEDAPAAAAAFGSLAATLPGFRGRIRGVINQAIAEGVAAGRFDITPGESATNAVLGTSLQSIRSRLLGETSAADAPDVVRLVLRVLGTSANDIDTIVDQSLAATMAA